MEKGARLWAAAQAPGGLWDGVLGTVPSVGPASGHSSWKAAPLACRPGEEPDLKHRLPSSGPNCPLPLQDSSAPPPPNKSGSVDRSARVTVPSNSGTLVGAALLSPLLGLRSKALGTGGLSSCRAQAPLSARAPSCPPIPMVLGPQLPCSGVRRDLYFTKGNWTSRGAFGWRLRRGAALGC